MRAGLLVPELVRRAHGLDGDCRGCVVASVDLGEDVTVRDRVTALGTADHADRVIDVVGLRASAGAELERRDGDGEGAETRDDAVSVSEDVADDGCARQRGRIGVATLRADPALVHRQSRAVRDGRLGSAPPFVGVDAEVRQAQQARAGLEHELGEVGRPLAAHGVVRLADLKALPTAAPSGWSMSVSRQTTSFPARRPRSSICSARMRASSTVFMKAPSPTFTSRTIASAPPASFFDMIDEASRGTRSTVAVTSRSA